MVGLQRADYNCKDKRETGRREQEKWAQKEKKNHQAESKACFG